MRFPEEYVSYSYKYLKFNEDSLKIIREGTIKFTCPLEFNDPFDCRPFIDPQSVENLPNERPDLMQKIGKPLDLSPAKRIRRKNEGLQRLKTI